MEKKKKKTFNLTLYRKEQIVICFILLCFVVSGFYLPIYREQLMLSIEKPENGSEFPDKEILENEILENEILENEILENETFTEEDSDSSGLNNKQTLEKPENELPSNGSSTTSENEPSNNHTSKPESSKPEASKPETSDKDSETTEKEWVPSVYEIIHHEAVYETKRVVICNYCSETFNTTGEFQVHKNANGG